MRLNKFDTDQLSLKFAQRKYFFCYFYYKKKSILGSLDNAENAKRHLFFDTQYLSRVEEVKPHDASWTVRLVYQTVPAR